MCSVICKNSRRFKTNFLEQSYDGSLFLKQERHEYQVRRSCEQKWQPFCWPIFSNILHLILAAVHWLTELCHRLHKFSYLWLADKSASFLSHSYHLARCLCCGIWGANVIKSVWVFCSYLWLVLPRLPSNLALFGQKPFLAHIFLSTFLHNNNIVDGFIQLLQTDIDFFSKFSEIFAFCHKLDLQLKIKSMQKKQSKLHIICMKFDYLI